MAQVLRQECAAMEGSIALQHKESGLTAFELAVALAIIAIMAALTLPPYMQWRQKAQLSGAASNLATDLEMAKTQAIRANRTVVVDFETSNYILFVDSGDGGGGPPNWNREAGEELLLERVLPPGVRIDTGSLSFPTVSDKTRFNSRGIPVDIVTPETISLVQGANNRQLTINRLGNIDVQ
ncbi:MAG: GspH/FimT family protein [Desulfobacterales bacterium]